LLKQTKVSDSNDGKQIFAFGSLIYHTFVTLYYLPWWTHQDTRMSVLGLIIHGGLMGVFAYFLNQHGFFARLPSYARF